MDLAGLGCLAFAVYLGYVVYLGWNGGTLGNGAEDSLAYAVGAGAALAPAALLLIGFGLILRPLLPSPGTLAAGVTAIVCGLLLALAAQTAGLGPDGAREGLFQPSFFSEHGGGLGEVLYWASTTLFQRLGAHILAVLLLIAGALLVWGRSLSDLVSAAGRGYERARRGAGDFATAVRETGYTDPDLVETEPEDTERLYGPPEPVAETPMATRIDPEEAGAGDEDSGVANFDEAVQLGDEVPDEPDTETIRIKRAAQEEFGAQEIDEGAEPGTNVTPMGVKRSAVTESEEIDYRLPPPDLLEKGKPDKGPDSRDRDAVARTLLEALGHFGVEAKLVGVVSGPHVSRYELRLAPGTKVAKISQLKDDLAYALASTEIRILAPIPGKQAVGVEVPNQRRRLVRLGDIYGGRPKGSSPLAAWLGKDISGQAIWTDLQKMPHVLVAGTTGSGKSGSVNAILTSILLHSSPNDVRLVLVDPKQVELNHYERIPHLLTPVVTSPRLAANVLNNLIAEMESRYGVMSEARARNLAELNRARASAGEPPLPHILCVIDELADLMMVAPAEVEDAVIRLAQKSRAVGIHLLLATQRPSTDIITGTIKVNIPARIAFAVSSQVDSRVILDQGGAETLLGQGDMLFRPAGTSKLQRVQGAFVTEEEIAKITSHWAQQGEPEFAEELLEAAEPSSEEGVGEDDFDPDQDDLLQQAAQVVVESGTASVSMIQRRLRVGYTRAGRLIDMLERRGIISGYEGSKPRQVLVSISELPRALGAGPAAQDDNSAPDGPDTGELDPVAHE
jgi:DNA segregation ATPase FtsK/SpoIIIE, S-DNA-T family